MKTARRAKTDEGISASLCRAAIGAVASCLPALSAVAGALFFAVALCAVPGPSLPVVSFSYADVVAQARALAAAPYAPEREQVPRFYLELFTEQFREIRFRPEKSIWNGTDSPWRMRLLHPGLSYNRVARLFTVEEGRARELRYDPERFSFGTIATRPAERPGGHAGFSLHTSGEASGSASEAVVAFVGGSHLYCIPAGVGAVHGVSARGIAINTALRDLTEDFPFFKKYWIERQPAGSAHAVVYALMDSPHVCGAYRFVITPARRTTAEVEVVFFVREKMARLGLAPLSAMYWFGENTLRKPDDFRREVHSADGLLFKEAAGSVRWRPLGNGDATRHSTFAVENLAGFGLRQRDTAFASYQDIEGAWHRRPGTWVEPLEGWSRGTLHLIEQPASQETWENVVCYWQPEPLPAAGTALKLRYRVTWAREKDFPETALAHVLATHAGRKVGAANQRNYVVDFSPLSVGTGAVAATVTAHVAVTGGAQLGKQRLLFNNETQGWRLVLEIKPYSSDASYEMKAVLRRDGRDVSEYWDYMESGVR
ncbi:MAG: glucan biosynthesis protein [Puniceicoccales bacterium]|nr:glucan biosynthesis protein [Puniceicoccales bacterium]